MSGQQVAFFNKLFEANYKQLLYEATKALQNPAVAEEIVESAFEKLLERLDQVQAHENPGGWLEKVTENLIANERKQAHYRFEQSYRSEDRAEPQSEDCRLDKLTYSLPNGLREEDRKLLILYFEELYSYDVIAQMLQISVVACRTKLFRAKKRCGKLMKQDMGKKRTLR